MPIHHRYLTSLALLFIDLLGIPAPATASEAAPKIEVDAADLLPQKRVWKEIRTANFIFVGDVTDRRLKDAAVSMERLFGVLQGIAPRPVDPPIPTVVYVFKTRKDFNRFGVLYNGELREDGGYFMSRPHANFITIASTDFDRSRATVQHELVHFFMNYNVPGLPPWLGEGLAELYENFEVGGKFVNIGKIHVRHLQWLDRNELIPLLDLFRVTHDSPIYNEDDRRGVFYSQSWLLTHYLLLGSDGGDRELLKFLDLSKAMPIEEAFSAAFERSPEELEKELRRYIRSSRFTYRKAPFDREKDGLELQIREVPRPEIQARFGELAALHRDRPEQARAYLKAALEQNPQEPRAHLGLGLMALLPAEGAPNLDTALNHFAQARHFAPDDLSITFLMASTQAQRGDPPKLLRNPVTRVVNARPQWKEAWDLLAWTWQGSHPDDDLNQKIAVFTGALNMNPDKEPYARTLLKVLQAAGENEKAQALIERYFNARGLTVDVPLTYRSSEKASSTGSETRGALEVTDSGLARDPEVEKVMQEVLGDSREREALFDKANDLVIAEKYDEALVLFDELRRLDPFNAMYQSRYSELEKAVSHNRFLESYNRAVNFFNAYRWKDTVEELEALLPKISNPEQVAKAEKLLDQARAERKKRGDSGY